MEEFSHGPHFHQELLSALAPPTTGELSACRSQLFGQDIRIHQSHESRKAVPNSGEADFKLNNPDRLSGNPRSPHPNDSGFDDKNLSLFGPRVHHRLIQARLTRSNPWHVMFLGDPDRRMAEDRRDFLKAHTSQKRFDSECIAEHVGMTPLCLTTRFF
jgi:hypothetical protein